MHGLIQLLRTFTCNLCADMSRRVGLSERVNCCAYRVSCWLCHPTRATATSAYLDLTPRASTQTGNPCMASRALQALEASLALRLVVACTGTLQISHSTLLGQP